MEDQVELQVPHREKYEAPSIISTTRIKKLTRKTFTTFSETTNSGPIGS